MEPRIAALLALAGPSQLLEVVAPARSDRAKAKKRIAEAAEQVPTAAAVKYVIEVDVGSRRNAVTSRVLGARTARSPADGPEPSDNCCHQRRPTASSNAGSHVTEVPQACGGRHGELSGRVWGCSGRQMARSRHERLHRGARCRAPAPRR